MGRRLAEKLKGQPVPGIVRTDQIAGKGQQLAAVLGQPLLVQAIVFLQPWPGLGGVEGAGIRGQAELAAAQLARQVHHLVQLRTGQHPAGIKQRLVGHHQPGGGFLAKRHGGGQMGVDPLAPDGQPGQFFLHALLAVKAGLARVQQRRPDQHVRQLQDALDKGKGRIAVQGRMDMARGAGAAQKEHVFPRDQHIVKDDQRLDLVKAVGQRIVTLGPGLRKARAADEFQPRRVLVADKADGVIRLRGIAPIGDRGLHIGEVRIGRRGFELGAAHDDAGIGFAHHMQRHVRVLRLRRL